MGIGWYAATGNGIVGVITQVGNLFEKGVKACIEGLLLLGLEVEIFGF